MSTPSRHRALYVFWISLLLLTFNLGRAPMTFDEGFYVKAAREFLAGTSTSNAQHPPLAKYFIAVSIKIFGDTAFGWRFPSALAGALAALAVFGITCRLTRSARTATIAWILTIANGFWFVMSRVAMLSIYELAFELAGVWVFLIAWERSSGMASANSSVKWFAISGGLFGLSFACRWSGIIGLIACLIVAVIERVNLRPIAILLVVFVSTYFAAWIPLFLREGRPLTGLAAANRYIYDFHRHAPADPRLGEPWWTWFLRVEPQQALSHLVANPMIGVLGLVAIFVLIVKRVTTTESRAYILSLLYLGHVGQWMTGVRPQTFYYYYFEAFMVLAPALAIAMQGMKWRKIRADVVVTACSLLFFAYWYPTWASLPAPYNLLTGPH